MRRFVNRRTLLVLLGLLLLAVLVPPFINVNRFKPRIAGALSNALGRPVSIESVRLRLLPTPGLNLTRLVVQDDPAFSAEPMLRADEVTASLRLASLWRGRLEIAQLSLSYPSLNLVRRPDGHWNLESLLERVRQTPTAPTTKRHAEARLRFPYVEADGGRINLKIGQEKTVYALSEADFALWAPSENQWRLRLNARPVRTDANLSDTGRVKVSGSVERAASLSETPVKLSVALDRAQLGQLTTLIYGRDRGWRGAVSVNAAVSGTPTDLTMDGDVSVDDFRRYDIATSGDLRLQAHCSAVFSTTWQTVRDLACHAPVGAGAVDLRGTVTGVFPARDFALGLTAQQIPAASLASLARRMKKDLPEDLAAGGTLTATLEARRAQGVLTFAGSGSSEALELRTAAMQKPLRLGAVQFAIGEDAAAAGHKNSRVRPVNLAGEGFLLVEPFPVDLGAPSPARVQAWFSREEYNIAISGEADVPRLLGVGGALGIAAPPITATGTARLDLKLAGAWAGFAPPLVTGTAQVRAAAKLPGLNAPMQIASAMLTLDAQAITARNLSVSFPGTRVAITGTASLPRRCIGSGQCSLEFQLASDSISSDDCNALLNPAAVKRPWYDLIGGGPKTNSLLRLKAHGEISAARVLLRSLTASHVSGEVTVEDGKVNIANLRAEALGGKLTGELRADFTGAQPTFAGEGRVEQASVAALAAVTHDTWGTGRISAAYSFAMAGTTAAQLRSSASGRMDFTWLGGTVSRIALGGNAAPLRVQDFRGQVTLRDGVLTFVPSKLQSASGIYTVSGTASLDRRLGLVLARGKTAAFQITGTLDKPRVVTSPAPATRAALKQ
jgi:hypothetical protein